MENLALIVLEWVGKIIAGKLAGSAFSAAWKRVYPAITKTLKSSRLTKLEAEAEASKVEKLERQVENYFILLREAALEIDRLNAENAELRARLAKGEPRQGHCAEVGWDGAFCCMEAGVSGHFQGL